MVNGDETLPINHRPASPTIYSETADNDCSNICTCTQYLSNPSFFHILKILVLHNKTVPNIEPTQTMEATIKVLNDVPRMTLTYYMTMSICLLMHLYAIMR